MTEGLKCQISYTRWGLQLSSIYKSSSVTDEPTTEARCRGFAAQISEALDLEGRNYLKTEYKGAFRLTSVFDVSGLALATMTAAAEELAALVGAQDIIVDRRAVELWCDTTIKADGWKMPDAWDSVAGNYRVRDGWIRLHTNVPSHLAAALQVLGVPAEREQVAHAVASWDRFELERAVVEAGGVAAAMIGLTDWAAHPQGQAVASEPLIDWKVHPSAPTSLPEFYGNLQGLRVLDLTRVLAGPVATRFLAGFGASVLRIDPPHWHEDGLEAEVTLGKACAGLDLRLAHDRERFETLLSEAHIIVHGYRPGALERLGYGEQRRRELNPGILDITLSAYGWTVPWQERRGFDSILQVHTGLAQEGMERTGADKPVPLPVQVLDHGTGYLMAAAVLRALYMQRADGHPRSARLSLARTARLLVSGGLHEVQPRDSGIAPIEELPEMTHWGPARRIAFPIAIDARRPVWRLPAAPFRTAPAEWPNLVS
jgi:hypothetical protein